MDVILDDRDERPGAMLADWELIGVPHRVVLGDRGLKEGVVRIPSTAGIPRPPRLRLAMCWPTSRPSWACN